MDANKVRNFNPADIIELAISVETNGEALYARLAAHSRDERAKSVWVFLRDQEIAHRELFQQMLARVGDYFPQEFGDGEYARYMQALAADFIITPQLIAEKIRAPLLDEMAAVEFGISIEKESIIAYSMLLDTVLPERRQALTDIIAEEKKHLVRLCLLQDYFRAASQQRSH